MSVDWTLLMGGGEARRWTRSEIVGAICTYGTCTEPCGTLHGPEQPRTLDTM